MVNLAKLIRIVFLVTHAGIAAGIGRHSVSSVCLSVCLYSNCKMA